MATRRTSEPHHSARRVLAGDPWVAVLGEAFGDLNGKIAAADVWDILGKRDRLIRTQDDNFRLGEAMRALGWTRASQRVDYASPPIRAYFRGTRVERRVPIYVFHDPLTGEILVTQSTDPIRDDIRPVGWKARNG
jgi:hypothetical protein